MPSEVSEISAQLEALVREKTGDPGARCGSLLALPGHAGQSYSFELDWRAPDGPSHEKLVLRLAPAGVRISGPADVARQGRIMASLADAAVPVPPVRWLDDGPRPFGRPYFVVRFVEGQKLYEMQATPEQARAMVSSVIDALVALHAVDWQSRRAAWGDPVALVEEMKRLDHLLERETLDPAVVSRAPELRERLRSSLPEKPRVGCVHGDFQWSNLILQDARLAAAIDWEISMVSATLLDLGWICLFSDPDSWTQRRLAFPNLPSPDELVALYTERAHFAVEMKQVRWFQAFSAYRFGVITVFNLMLHRRGKRQDPVWEEMGKMAPRLFDRGLELLDQGAAS